MQLTDIQKDRVRQWAAEGDSLSKIQDRLMSEFDIRMSYIDVRLLVLELQVAIQEKAKPKEIVPPASPAPSAQGASPMSPNAGMEEDVEDESPMDAMPAGGGVNVSVSRITKPGFAYCGDVTFSDGTKAEWGITSHGELALTGGPAVYRPSPEDVRAFQMELRNQLT